MVSTRQADLLDRVEQARQAEADRVERSRPKTIRIGIDTSYTARQEINASNSATNELTYPIAWGYNIDEKLKDSINTRLEIAFTDEPINMGWRTIVNNDEGIFHEADEQALILELRRVGPIAKEILEELGYKVIDMRYDDSALEIFYDIVQTS